jgi:hypothetical protein
MEKFASIGVGKPFSWPIRKVPIVYPYKPSRKPA